MVLTAVLFVGYLIVLIVMGILQSRKIQTMESYWMANRNLPAYRVAFVLAASWFGLSSFTGQAGWVYGEGLGAFWYLGIPNFAAILIIGLFFSGRIRRLPVISQPEFLEMRYSGAIRPWLGIIILLAFSGYAAMEYIAMNYVFEHFMGWPGWLGNILVLVCIMVYVQFGGMNTVVWTQVIQYLALLLSGLIVGVAGIVYAGKMIASGQASVPVGTSVFAVPHLDGANWWSFGSIGIFMVFTMIIAYWPGWATEQDPWQRVWMARDTNTARKGAIGGAILNGTAYFFTLLMAVAAWTILGAPSESINSEEIVYLIMLKTLPWWVIAVATVGFAAAAMSNISVFSTSAASNVVKDWYQRIFRPHASQKEMILASRVIIVICLVFGMFIAFVIPTILDVLFLSATLATTGYFVPIVGGLFWRRANSNGALASLILGGGSDIVFYAMQRVGGVEFALEPVIYALVISLAAFIIGSLATKAPGVSKLVPFFSAEAQKYIDGWKAIGVKAVADDEAKKYVAQKLDVHDNGERKLLNVPLAFEGLEFSTAEKWQSFVDELLKNKSWLWAAGYDVVYKIVSADMLANVRMARGHGLNDVMIYCEPENKEVDKIKDFIAVAVTDLKEVSNRIKSK